MNLSVRIRTRLSQVLAADLNHGKTDFCRRIMKSFHNRVNNVHYFVNMDQTSVYMNCAPTVHRKGEKTVSIRVGGVNLQHFSLAVAVALDGTKLPLFVVFKATPSGNIERSLPRITPDGIVSAVQDKGWMDTAMVEVWHEKVWKLYIAGYDGESGLLLDDYICHKDDELYQKMKSDKKHRWLVPPYFTSNVQPCNVGINKPLKNRLKIQATKWRGDK